MTEQAQPRAVAAVPDLFFQSKISGTANQLGVTVRFAQTKEALLAQAADGARLVLVDLAAAGLEPVDLIARLKADPATRELPVVAFANHERSDLMEAARAAGCDEVLTRGAFSQGLADILRRAQRES